ILCAVLTGRPPYVAESAVTVLQQAAQADLADARERLRACGADAELIALARDCLSPEPAGRPRDAGEGAAAVAGYQEGVQERLRRGEGERAAAEAKALEHAKRRRVQLALALVISAALAAAGGVWFWLDRQRAAARRELTAALDDSRRHMAA